MQNYVQLAIFTFPSEYTVLEHLLQQGGVRYFFRNETMISVLPFHSNAVGGIRLMVHPEDVEVSKQIISDLENSSGLNIV